MRAAERAEPNWELGGVGEHCALWLPRGCAPGWRAPGWHKKTPPLHRDRAIPSVPRMGLQVRPIEMVKSYKPHKRHRAVTKSDVLSFSPNLAAL